MKLDHEQLCKKDIALLALLGARQSVFVHLDSRTSGVRVPRAWANQPHVVLQLGRALTVPIPDLDVSAFGVRATLSFGRTPHLCVIPWRAVFALVGDDGEGVCYGEDVPDELFQKAVEEKKPRPPWLKGVIDGGKQ